MKTLGRHLLAEFYDCDVDALDDVDAIGKYMHDAAEAVGATVVGALFHRYQPQGVSGTLLIAESHLSVHTWPEVRYVAVDIFTCGGLDPRGGFRLLAGALGAKGTRMHEIVRGLPAEIDSDRALVPDDVTLITCVASLSIE